MLKIAFRYLLVLLAICGISAKGFFPSSLGRCPVDDEQCFKTQAQKYVDHYKFGIPEQNIPSIEPLEVGAMHFQLGSEKSSFEMNLMVPNAFISNFGNNLTVISLKINASTTDLSAPVNVIWKFSFPQLVIDADYALKGKFLILPLDSKGKIKVTLTKVVVTATAFMQPEKRADGNIYLKILMMGLSESIESIKVYFSNLFKDPAINESTVKVFNDEFASFEGTMRPILIDAIRRKANALLQKLFDVIPYDGMFLNKKA
ncbi:hypothetical protein KR044_005713 [Drosophila immigrans]|nr:hypothetical protein KR044_005713 [Drosophila immigrans]